MINVPITSTGEPITGSVSKLGFVFEQAHSAIPRPRFDQGHASKGNNFRQAFPIP
jgi:hypothetical protein